MRRATAIVTTFTLFVLPIILLMVDVVPVAQRHWVLIAVVGAVAVVARYHRWSWRDLGCRVDTVRTAVIPYAILATIGAAFVVAIASMSGRAVRLNWWLAPHVWGLFLPISIAQEFLYRSVLIPLLRRIHRASWFVIGVNAALFAFMHVLFPDPQFVLPMTFLAGTAFAALWLRWPNLWLASAVHAVMNLSFVLFCFGGYETSCLRL
jgi:membrane protease YdiL (CAAX protease family)